MFVGNMSTYVPSTRVHSVLRRVLGSWFRDHDWTKRRGSICAFTRARTGNGGYWCFWVQCSQRGGSDLGNSFTVNLSALQSLNQPLIVGPNSRVLRTLSDVDRNEGVALEKKVVARIPVPPQGSRIDQLTRLPGIEGEIFREYRNRSLAPHPEPWMQFHDIWLRYFSEEDIADWAAFLLTRLPYLTAACNASSS